MGRGGRIEGGGDSSLLCSTDKAQSLFRVERGLGCMEKRREHPEFLEREGLQLFVMTVCLHGPSTFHGKCGAGLVVTGLEKSGPEKIYRETEILTCTWGPKTALAIPARLVFLLRGVDML